MAGGYRSPERRSAGRSGCAEQSMWKRGPMSNRILSVSCQLLSSTSRCFCCPASLLDTARTDSGCQERRAHEQHPDFTYTDCQDVQFKGLRLCMQGVLIHVLLQ